MTKRYKVLVRAKNEDAMDALLPALEDLFDIFGIAFRGPYSDVEFIRANRWSRDKDYDCVIVGPEKPTAPMKIVVDYWEQAKRIKQELRI